MYTMLIYIYEIYIHICVVFLGIYMHIFVYLTEINALLIMLLCNILYYYSILFSLKNKIKINK